MDTKGHPLWHTAKVKAPAPKKRHFCPVRCPGKDTGHDEDGGEAAETQAEKPNPAGPRLGQALRPPGQKEL